MLLPAASRGCHEGARHPAWPPFLQRQGEPRVTESPILSHERIRAAGAEPTRWMLVLPGVFGAGRNWSTVARKVVAARPEWGAVLVDLRQHGASQGFPPPHTLAACADDLRRLVAAESLQADALLGHSFGGKVGLVY